MASTRHPVLVPLIWPVTGSATIKAASKRINDLTPEYDASPCVCDAKVCISSNQYLGHTKVLVGV